MNSPLRCFAVVASLLAGVHLLALEVLRNVNTGKPPVERIVLFAKDAAHDHIAISPDPVVRAVGQAMGCRGQCGHHLGEGDGTHPQVAPGGPGRVAGAVAADGDTGGVIQIGRAHV